MPLTITYQTNQTNHRKSDLTIGIFGLARELAGIERQEALERSVVPDVFHVGECLVFVQ